MKRTPVGLAAALIALCIVSIHGLKGTNDRCEQDSECTSGICSFAGSLPRCAAGKAKRGGACYRDFECEDSLTCNVDYEQCAGKVPQGEGCKRDIQCANGLQCIGGSCSKKRGLKQACDKDDDCQSSFGCSQKKHACVQRVKEGKGCGDESPCEEGLTCTGKPNVCKKTMEVKLGEQCGDVKVCGQNQTCYKPPGNQNTKSTCVKNTVVKEGEMCDQNGPKVCGPAQECTKNGKMSTCQDPRKAEERPRRQSRSFPPLLQKMVDALQQVRRAYDGGN